MVNIQDTYQTVTKHIDESMNCPPGDIFNRKTFFYLVRISLYKCLGRHYNSECVKKKIKERNRVTSSMTYRLNIEY